MALDLSNALDELRARLALIEHAIPIMQQLNGTPDTDGTPKRRRGRKAMNQEQRAEVSERMKKYWQGRRDKNVGSRNVDSGKDPHEKKAEGNQG
jgi:hypothetical protein